MKIVLFYHSLISDWNHGNAHFLRGITSELTARNHDVLVYEPRNNWSLQNLLRDHGDRPLNDFHAIYKTLRSRQYDPDTLDLDEALDGADLVIVHEWNSHQFVKRIGEHRARARSYRLLFHDTHHRAVSAPHEMEAYHLADYDGVLAYGETLRQVYIRSGWCSNVWTWHEAADIRLFHPMPEIARVRDLVWIGNWGDDERSAELHEFLIEPVRELGLSAEIFGVRYPEEALSALQAARIDYRGWLANYAAPIAFAQARLTVHVPRRFYVTELPGIPTIRPFEALACGIPLISALWRDEERLFTPGKDYLVAESGNDVKRHMQAILNEPELAQALSSHGRRTILERHTCGHRVDELLAIYTSLAGRMEPGAKAEERATEAVAN